MSNQLAIKVHTHPGDEIIIDHYGHIYLYETAAAAALSGVQVQTVIGKYGKLSVDMIEGTVHGSHEWEPNSRVLCIENTTNKGGGACYTETELLELGNFAIRHGLDFHIDGARIWNALTESGLEPSFFGKIADSISVCFSKGLGAPVGSMLLASAELIERARRYRKMWGGGMRQVGLLAAAADYALENHFHLLKKDHQRARWFAETVDSCSKLQINMDSVSTNIILFDVVDGNVEGALEKLAEKGILMVPFGGKTIRATFHFQLTDEDIDTLLATTSALFA